MNRPRSVPPKLLAAAAGVVLVTSALLSFHPFHSTPEDEAIHNRVIEVVNVPDTDEEKAGSARNGTRESSTASGADADSEGRKANGKSSQQDAGVAIEIPAARCWHAEFAIEGALRPAQKTGFGEREHLLDLSKLAESFPKWSSDRLCVRTQGQAVAFVREPKSPSRIRIRAGSGRIRPDSRLELSYCATGDCSPCIVEKDAFESALFGETAEVAAENDDADVTARLSPEVRRELERLDRESAPAPIDAWAAKLVNTSCGISARVAQLGGGR